MKKLKLNVLPVKTNHIDDEIFKEATLKAKQKEGTRSNFGVSSFAKEAMYLYADKLLGKKRVKEIKREELNKLDLSQAKEIKLR